jgi:ABC-type branched-subunit amino acid transport system substrate-binding protein
MAGVAASPTGGDPIILGMSGPFSGSSANLGAELRSGMSVVFDATNAAGGIGGRPIELKTYDDGYEPEPAIRNTLRFIHEDDALALLSFVGTPTVTRVLPVLSLYRDEDVLLFFPFTGAEPQRREPYSRFAYNLRPSYRDETGGLVDRFVGAGKRRIALYYQADAYGRSGWDGVRSALADHGLDIVGEATYRRGAGFESDFGAQVEILEATGADAVISIASYAAAAGFIRDARDAGWWVPIANLSFVDSNSLKALLVDRSARTGTDYTARLVNSEVVPNYRDESLPAIREFRRLMRDQQADHETGMSFVSLEGFLNARLMVEILRRMGDDISRPRFREVLEGLSGLDLGVGELVTFGPNDNQGLEQVYFNRIENGEYVALEDWSEWLAESP